MDKVTNKDIHERTELPAMEDILIRKNLRWTEHFTLANYGFNVNDICGKNTTKSACIALTYKNNELHKFLKPMESHNSGRCMVHAVPYQ